MPQLNLICDQKENTLAKFLSSQIAHYSGKQIKNLIDGGFVSVNESTARKASMGLKENDRVAVRLDLYERRHAIQAVPKVLFETPFYLFCNKPFGWESDADILTKYFGKTMHLVHRLDKETSGVLLLALTGSACRTMQKLFRQRKIRKKYVAIVEGKFKKKQGVIEGSFAPSRKLEGQTLWTGKAKQGLYASTHYQVLDELQGLSFVLLQPHTGRTHQLRVQLSELGHPILGDRLYGSKKIVERLFLHAYELSFTDPFSSEDICQQAPIPREFKELIHQNK